MTRESVRWIESKKCWEFYRTNEQPHEICFRFMTPEQIAAHKKTSAYLQQCCIAANYDPKICPKELDELTARSQRVNEESWEIALSTAKVKVYDDYESQPDILRDRAKRESLEVALAERMMLDLGFAPPHWKEISQCEQCGPMPAKNRIDACSWCATQTGRILGLARENVQYEGNPALAKYLGDV